MRCLPAHIGTDGVLRQVAGAPSSYCPGDQEVPCGEGGPAASALLDNGYGGLPIATSGTSLYLGEYCYVRKLGSPLSSVPQVAVAGVGGGTILPAGISYAPSKDGSSIYEFDYEGRHLRTLDRRTGAEILRFNYSAGRLDTIVEGTTDGTSSVQLTTTVHRDASGFADQVQAPWGQLTGIEEDPANPGYTGTVHVPGDGDVVATYYDAFGLLKSFSDANLHSSSYAFDAMGRLQSAVDRSGQPLTFTRTDTSNGYDVAYTSPMDRETTYSVEHSGVQWSQENTFPDGTSAGVTFYGLSDRDSSLADGTRVQQQMYPDPIFGFRDPYAHWTKVTLPGTGSIEVGHRRSFERDPTTYAILTHTETETINGKTWTRFWNPQTRVLQVTSPESRQVKIHYDERGLPWRYERDNYATVDLTWSKGRVSTVTRGARTPLSLGYDDEAGDGDPADGYLSRVTGNDGEHLLVTRYEHDAMGRVRLQSLPNEGLDLLKRTAIAYDGNGNALSVTPPGHFAPPALGHTEHGFTFTSLGQVDLYKPPAVPNMPSKDTDYDYNNDRQQTTITLPGGGVIGFAYDDTPLKTGRLKTVTLPAGEGAMGLTYHPTRGYLQTLSGPGSETLTFERNGSLPTSMTWTGDVAGDVTWTHDADFRLATESVNGGSAVAMLYDSDGLPTCVGGCTLVNGSVMRTGDVFEISRNDPLRQVSTVLGHVTSNVWDNVPRVSTTATASAYAELSTYEASHIASNGTVTPLYAATYGRDDLGRITSKSETISSPDSSWAGTLETGYTYDTHGRLETVKEDGDEKAHYVYDDNGNRLNDGHLEFNAKYDAQDRIETYNSTQYVYTANGDLQQRTGLGGTTTYSYDALGNLRSATLPGGDVMTYVVDGLGRRVGTQKNGVWTQRLLYRSQLQPVAEFDGNNVMTRYVYASGRNVPEYALRGGQQYSIITDHLGSVRLVVEVASNTIKQRMDYDAYGRVTEYIAPSWQPLPFGFAGGLYDRDTGLVRFGARDYDSETGRWTSKDPILFGGGDANLFGYVVGDPVNSFDSTGLTVYLCSRVAELFGDPATDMEWGFRHEWLWDSESGFEAGMGPAPGGWGGFRGLFQSTSLNDHRGAHNEVSWKDVQCEPQPSVDEACVDSYIDPSLYGQSLGHWIPVLSDCSAFTASVLRACHPENAEWMVQGAYGM